MPTDAELLQAYVRENTEEAFTEFVRRNVGLVYAAALRRSNGRAHLAEEITQKVFADSSRKAAALSRHPNLSAWLYCSTRYAAIDALRAEQRRAALAQSLSAMQDSSSAPDPQVDWDQLRPVLDKAMDALRERDRELMLLRFFSGLSFPEMGARLGLSENAARKGTDRALEKLRSLLEKRGVASSSAALALLLTHQALATAPAAVAARVAETALATAPAKGLAGVLTGLLMGKVTGPASCALAGAGLTAAVWSQAVPSLQAEKALLQGEFERLHAATAAGAPSATIAAVAREYARNAEAVAQALGTSRSQLRASATRTTQGALPAARLSSTHGYENLGQATAPDAIVTFAWACDVADPETLSALVYLDDRTREHARKVLLTMPEGVRTQCPTPEEFYGLLLAASCLEAPPPDSALARRMINLAELGPGRVASRLIGSSHNIHEFQQTPTGWKYVLPDNAIESLPRILNSATLARLSRQP